VREVSFLLILCLLCLVPAIAQSPNATITGIVLDPSGAAIAGAEVVVVNDATGVQYTTRTNGEGIYVVPNLPPGTYRIQVSNSGFKTIIKPDIAIHVQDALAINFTLPIGAASEVMTIQGGAPLINTTNASVSTVVDREYVENMPLNGRSFQDLILLTPGVVTTSPQSQAVLGSNGEFSVNGQRTESNYYTVDGVSANVGVVSGAPSAASTSGSLPGVTGLGTTQALVSVDALEEFRVQTSSYSAEYGRNPGGQFSFATRSGTNQWHGTAFDYLRNNVFDANDWFNNYFKKAEPALRQNDFGGTLGGPVEIPGLYEGKDKSFFFFSYEGLRLRQPQAAQVFIVPTAALRQSAATAIQPVLNAFPVSNCVSSSASCVSDLGNGFGDFVGTWSNPGSIDAYSVRLDQAISQNLRLFFRFSDTPSKIASRLSGSQNDPADLFITTYENRTYTVGATSALSIHAGNEFRLNYTSNSAAVSGATDNLGGATPADFLELQGVQNEAAPFNIAFRFFPAGAFSGVIQTRTSGEQRQWNLVDTVSISRGPHLFRFGADYRRLAPRQVPNNPVVTYEFLDQTTIKANSVDFGFVQAHAAAYPIYSNLSAFAQDEWRVTSRLALSFGLRWEVNPAPGAAKGNLPYTVAGTSLSTLTVAPQGTPLWRTTWYNFAPRLGAAYLLRNTPGWEMVARGGGGVFFDSGQQLGSIGYSGPGFSAETLFGTFSPSQSPASFPLPAGQLNPPISNPPVAPFTSSTVYAFPPHLQLPYTLQWNASVQQALGKSQALSLSYVGSHASRLLEQTELNIAAVNPNFGVINFFKNGLSSDYHALQLEFQRSLASGLQALASYSWSHSIDYGSNNAALPYQRGNSDFDVRSNFSGAVSYDMPGLFANRFARGALQHWAMDGRFTARAGFPVTLNGNVEFDPATGEAFTSGLNLVSGQPLYLHGSQYPGGREINPAAFSEPATGQIGNAPRNFVRGFGAWQMDFALRREFPLHERLKLMFRAEAFNLFNHPNFGVIDSNYCPAGPGCTFGQATQTLAQSLGVLSPLYQMGGPRSLQLALKLSF